MRTDQPEAREEVADRRVLPEPPGDRDRLGDQLRQLPPGHPALSARGDKPDRAPELRRDVPDARPLSDDEHGDHAVRVRDLMAKAGAEGLDTESRYRIGPDEEAWEPERRIEHNAIIAEIYEAATEVPCERKAILAGGLPGAGKSTVLENQAGIDRSQYIKVNPDDIKEKLAARGLVPEVPGLTPMEASELVHEESSHVAKRLAVKAMADGKNLIWDITMSSRESTEKRISDLRSFGYERVEAIFVDVTEETSLRRADARHREDHDKYRAGDGLGGRLVPPENITAQADPEWGSRNRRTFEQIKPKLDGWLRCDNSVDGRPAEILESSHHEQEPG